MLTSLNSLMAQVMLIGNKASELDGNLAVFTESQVQKMLNDDPNDGWGNTNWIEETFGVGTTGQHSLTASGGNEKVKFFASVGYMDQKGNIKNFNNKR